MCQSLSIAREDWNPSQMIPCVFFNSILIKISTIFSTSGGGAPALVIHMQSGSESEGVRKIWSTWHGLWVTLRYKPELRRVLDAP